jgi:hypothetical protein
MPNTVSNVMVTETRNGLLRLSNRFQRVCRKDLLERAIKDGQQLISILSKVTPSVQVINVQKRRELHVWPSGGRNGATIELTEISIPEKVMTIGIEHQDLEKVTKALEYLQLTSHSMRVLSYVDCLRVWEEKSLF